MNTARAFLEFDSCVVLTAVAELLVYWRTPAMCFHVHGVTEMCIHLPLNVLSFKMPAAIYVQGYVG